MAPLTKSVNRQEKVHPPQMNVAPVKAGEKIFIGAYIMREAASAYAINGADTLNCVPLGVVGAQLFPTDPANALDCAIDNTNGSNGILTATTSERCVRYDQIGEYAFAVSAGTPKVGAPAFLVDNNTVSANATTNSLIAGEFTRPSPDGGWFIDIARRGLARA